MQVYRRDYFTLKQHTESMQDTKKKKKNNKQKKQKQTNKQTNAQEAHRPALSSPSEVITMLNRTENMRTKSKARLNMKRLLVKTTQNKNT